MVSVPGAPGFVFQRALFFRIEIHLYIYIYVHTRSGLAVVNDGSFSADRRRRDSDAAACMLGPALGSRRRAGAEVAGAGEEVQRAKAAHPKPR